MGLMDSNKNSKNRRNSEKKLDGKPSDVVIKWKRLITKHKNKILDMRSVYGSQSSFDLNESRSKRAEDYNRRISKASQELVLESLNEAPLGESYKSSKRRSSALQDEQMLQKMKQEMKIHQRELYNMQERRNSRVSQQLAQFNQLQHQPTIEESVASSEDMGKLMNVNFDEEDEVEKKDKTKVRGIDQSRSGDTYMRSAIPYLPRKAAVFCLLANIIFPGAGTIFSGLLSLVCGQPRMPSAASTICINIGVGSMQLFTVPFLLVGWIWSLVWGIYFILLSEEKREIEKSQHETTLKARVVGALDPSFRVWANK